MAKIVLFGFAIVAVAAILLRWKANDRANALDQLENVYKVSVNLFNDEIHLSASSPAITDLDKLGALIERAETLRDGTPLKPQVLDLTGNPNLESFRGVARLQCLRSIIAVDCPKLTSVEGIAGMPNLSELLLSHNKALIDVSSLRSLPSLVTLDLTASPLLQKAELEELPSLENLYLSSCLILERLDVSAFGKLKQLYLDNCRLITRIEGLEKLTQLTDLDVSNCQKITSFEGLEKLSDLVVLDLRNIELEDFSSISELPRLEIIRLAGQGQLTDLEPFSKLQKLREIYLEACPNLVSLKGLPLSAKYVGAIRCHKLKSLEGLGSAVNLEHIDIESCDGFDDISGIESLSGLLRISFRYCRNVKGVKQLEHNLNLSFVRLGDTGVIAADVEPLQKILKKTIFDFSVDE